MTANNNVLEVCEVSRTFVNLGGMFSRQGFRIPAVSNVSFSIKPGEVLGLVGESGSGKSTLARMILGLEKPDAGEVLINGINLHASRHRQQRLLRQQIQMVFQNPYAALNPLQRIDAAIVEPLTNFQSLTKQQKHQIAVSALNDVGLPERLLHAYPHQLSGGERQRVCIARALTVKPQLLVCDEAVSALDKTVQAQILTLLKQLQKSYNLAILFISHDLAAVHQVCDQLLVMCQGQIVERGLCRQILTQPKHPYSQTLLAANRYLEGASETTAFISAEHNHETHHNKQIN